MFEEKLDFRAVDKLVAVVVDMSSLDLWRSFKYRQSRYMYMRTVGICA